MAALKIFDSTGDTTTSTSTGALTGVGTAPTGYQTPTAASVANNDNAVIRVESLDGTVWEVQETVVTVSGGVYSYSRGTTLASSTGSQISWAAGTKNIYFVAAKELLAIGASTTQGDTLYHDGTKIVALAKNTTASRYLSNSGTSNNPAWAQVDLTNGVTGVLPGANGGAVGGWDGVAYVAAGDFSTSSNTAVNITGLSFSAVASATYEIEVSLQLTNAGDTAGSRVTINSTGGSPTLAAVGVAQSTVNAASAFGIGSIGGITPSINTTSTGLATLRLSGWVGAGTGSPTISVQVQKTTSGTVTVKAGSSLRWRKV